MKTEVVWTDITRIKPYEKNPRINDNAVEFVANSIKKFGFRQPIVVDKNYVIIVGHTRYKASQSLGMKEVPIIVADDLTEEQVKAYRIADNSVGEISEWDYEMRDLEMGELPEFDFGDFGITVSEPIDIDRLFAPTDEQAGDRKKVKTIVCPHCGERFEL